MLPSMVNQSGIPGSKIARPRHFILLFSKASWRNKIYVLTHACPVIPSEFIRTGIIKTPKMQRAIKMIPGCIPPPVFTVLSVSLGPQAFYVVAWTEMS